LLTRVPARVDVLLALARERSHFVSCVSACCLIVPGCASTSPEGSGELEHNRSSVSVGTDQSGAASHAAGDSTAEADDPSDELDQAEPDAGAGCDTGTEASPCADGTWDDDADPATACVARVSCRAGEYVAEEGGPSADRTCAACAPGTFSTQTNASRCAAWSTCASGLQQGSLGSSTADRTCIPGPSSETWTRQFGDSGHDFANALGVDPESGDVYVAGTDVGVGASSSAGDALLLKYDSSGDVLWAQRFGTARMDTIVALGIDASGSLYVTGETGAVLPGQTSAGNIDTFLRKYDSAGNELWTRQFGGSADDRATALRVDGSGNVYVAGTTNGALPGQSGAGDFDPFLRKYDGAGNALWTRQFGTSAYDYAASVSTDGRGDVYLAGGTSGALPEQSGAGEVDVYVRKYDGAGAELWTRQSGTSAAESPAALASDADGNVYLAGATLGTLPDQTSAGDSDVFVRKYSALGAELWTRQFGTSGNDHAYALSAAESGDVYVAGYSSGTFPGQSAAGETDSFVRAYSARGAALWTQQFGTDRADDVRATALSADGALYLAGTTQGTLPGQSSAGLIDAYVMRLLPPR
jgi:hypothetical protein